MAAEIKIGVWQDGYSGPFRWVGPYKAEDVKAAYLNALEDERNLLKEVLERLLEETEWITRETSEWANSCAACGSIAAIDHGEPHPPDCPLILARLILARAICAGFDALKEETK